jgi:hypothetical protein
MLDGGGLHSLDRDKNMTPGGGKPAGKFLCPVRERLWRGALPELDVRPVEFHVPDTEPVEQRWADDDERGFVQLVNGQDRTAGDHNADYTLPQ